MQPLAGEWPSASQKPFMREEVITRRFWLSAGETDAMVERGILSGPNVPDLYDPTHSVGWEPA